jgi:hypothetical protein
LNLPIAPSRNVKQIEIAPRDYDDGTAANHKRKRMAQLDNVRKD